MPTRKTAEIISITDVPKMTKDFSQNSWDVRLFFHADFFPKRVAFIFLSVFFLNSGTILDRDKSARILFFQFSYCAEFSNDKYSSYLILLQNLSKNV